MVTQVVVQKGNDDEMNTARIQMMAVVFAAAATDVRERLPNGRSGAMRT